MGCIHISEFQINIIERLSDERSVHAVTTADIVVLQWVEEVRPERVVLRSDSAAVLKSGGMSKSIEEDIVKKITLNENTHRGIDFAGY